MPGEIGLQPAADEYYGHCVSQASAAGVPAISLASVSYLKFELLVGKRRTC
jgi:hypothetical protein